MRGNSWLVLIVAASAFACKRGGAPGPAQVGLNSAGLAIGGSTDLAVTGTMIALRVNESQQFASNLNSAQNLGGHNDTDTSDKVVFVYQASSQIAFNVSLAGSDPGNLLFRSGFLIFTVNEADEGSGGADLNSDGDKTDDAVLHLFNVSTLGKINTAQAVVKSTLVADDKILAFKLPSGNLAWLRIATPSTVFDSGVALIASAVPGKDFVVGNGFIVFLDNSDSTGKTGLPKAIDTVSISTPVSLGGGLAAKQGSLAISGGKAVYLQAEGAAPKNGDGDTTDFFPAVSDLNSEVVLGVPLTTSLAEEADSATFRVDGDRVAFLRKEADSGAAGTDHNGDGDKLDSVLFWFDAASPSPPQNTQLAGQELVLVAPRIAVSVPEADQNGSTSAFSGDLNGDGLVGAERVVFLLDTGTTPATASNLKIDGESLAMGTKVLAFGANESLQGGDLNGDGTINAGTVVSHAVDLPFLVVRNLRWQADTTFCIGQRAFFRVPEGQFGFADLNGDGEQSDSVVAYYDTANADGTLTAGTPLKAGFFGTASDDGMFVFLSEEADIGKDLNGDVDKLDRVVQFLKF